MYLCTAPGAGNVLLEGAQVLRVGGELEGGGSLCPFILQHNFLRLDLNLNIFINIKIINVTNM